MTTSMTLPKQAFLALAALGWVDGSLQQVEAVGLVRAAQACGIAGSDLADIERATKQRTAFEAASLGGMTTGEQVLTYALASWLASLDGIASTDERAHLSELGDALGLEEALRKRAAAVANDIACLPQGGRPERYDFVKLVARLRERMPQMTG
jgi:hypothetical protein